MADLISMLAAVAGSGGGADPNFNQTVLLLHGDGTNGAQNNTFIDSSTNNFTITRNGNTTQGTFSPFSLAAGEWSNNFDSTSRLRATASALSSSSFTVEGWFYYTGSSSTNATLFDFANAVNGYGMYASHSSAGNLSVTFYSNNAGSSIGTISSSFAGYYNTWVHIAATYDGSTYRLFLNGTSIGTPVSSATQVVAINSLSIGARSDSGVTQPWLGYMSNFRYVTGAALYTSTFTPPTSPLSTAGSGTTQVLTCQSNRFVDNTGNYTFTVSGGLKVTPFSPFAPTAAYSAGTNGGSGYFDGGSNGTVERRLSTTQTAIGTGNFTIAMWVYITGTTGLNQIFFDSGTGGCVFFINTSNQLEFQSRVSGGGSISASASTAIQLNTWVHVAVVRSGTSTNQTAIYINGVSVATGTVTANFTSTTVSIGARFAVSVTQWNTVLGYISSFLYANTNLTISIPTTPYTSDANTQLLLNFTNAGIFDNTGKNNLETVGNAQIDTTTKKFGTGSMEFDGSGDWLLMPANPQFYFGTGDYTIEAWVYINSFATTSQQLVFGSGSTSNDNIFLSLTSSSIIIGNKIANTLAASTTINTNTWYHIAACRSGTTLRIYKDGVQVGTTTDSKTWLSDGTASVGVFAANSGLPLNGFIDDLRITKGVARYTSNFTPPTAAFPDL